MMTKSGITNQDNSMYREEIRRLESFVSWPAGGMVQPTSLARAGLYYTGVEDIVCCFKCHTEFKNWKWGDLPMHRHRDYSPTCLFVKGDCTENVPFESDSLPFSVDRIFSLEKKCLVNGESSNGESVNYGEIKSILYDKYKALASKYPSADSRKYINGARDRSLETFHLLFGPRGEGTLNSNAMEGSEEGCLHAGGGSLTRGNVEHSEENISRLSLGNINTMSGETRAQRQQQRQSTCTIPFNQENEGLTDYCSSEDLARILPDSRHPEYSDIKVRYRTYTNWNHQQDPKNLVQAGLFYTGDEDRVRCFMCGGGLSAWEDGDIPLYEHHRWFGNCPYVRECRKNAVVAAILETAEHIHGPVLSSQHVHHHQHTGRTQCDVRSQEIKSESIQEKTTSSQSQIPKTEEPKTTEKEEQKPPKDLQSLRLENENLKASRTCKVCLESPVEVIFLPCSHLVCCLECSLQLEECPVCRASIKATARVHV